MKTLTFKNKLIPKTVLIHSTDDLPEFDVNLPIFADIETDGLYTYLRMLQIYQPDLDNTIYLLDIAPIGYKESERLVKEMQIKQLIMKVYTCWYRASYDLGTLNISPSMGAMTPDDITKDSVYTHRVDDLIYAMRSAYPEFMEFGLKKVVTKLPYLRNLYNGIEVKESAKSFTRGAYLSNNSYEYAATDVYALSLIYKDPKIQNVIQNNMAYKVDIRSQAYALIYQQNGLLRDKKLWSEKLEFAEKEHKKYMSMLPAGFNPNSFKQVRALLGSDQSDHAFLVLFKNSDSPQAKYAEYIIKAKKYGKQASYLRSIEFDRMYTKFDASGAVTGRFTSSGGDLEDHFNSQQIPRELQKIFTQDTEDTKVIDLDYSTLELRLACAIYGVSHMYKQFKEDRDLHTDMAKFITNKDIPPSDHPDIADKGLLPWGTNDEKYLDNKERNDAKSVNFGYVFGMSAASYVDYAYTNYEVSVTLPDSVKIRNAYFKLYPELADKHSEVWRNYKKPNYFVYTALGRKVKPKLGTDGINIPVQGSGGETTKLATHYMVKDNPLSLKYIYNVVHDAIYSRVPKNDESYWRELQRSSMIKGWTEISKSSIFKYKDIPMEVE